MNILRYLVVLIAFLIGGDLWSQTFLNVIGTPFRNEAGHVLHRSAAGDTYLGGSVGDSAVVMRMDDDGSVLWSRAFRTIGQFPKMVLHLADAPDGTLIGCGSGITGTQELAEGFYFRFDAAGNFLWVRSWEDPTIFARRIVVSDPGAYIVFGGVSDATVPTFSDLVNALVDAGTGDLIGTTDRMDLYNTLSYFDEIRGVATIGTQHYGVSSIATAQLALSGRRAALSKFDAFGQHVETHYLVYPNNVDRRIYPTDIVAKDDSLTIAYYGDINGSSGNWTVGLIRCDTMGNIAWARDFNLAGSGQEQSTRLLATATGYVLAGHTTTTAPNKLFLMSISNAGSGIWYKSYGPALQEQTLAEPYAFNVADMGNGYLLTGYTNQTGDRDILLIRTDEDGLLFCDAVNDRSAITTVLPTQSFVSVVGLEPIVVVQDPDQPVVGDAGVLNDCEVVVQLGADTTLCGQLTLDAGVVNATYEWSDGSADQTLEVTASGTYWVLVSVGCCIGSDTIVVDLGALANIDLGPDTTLCASEQLVLQPPLGSWTFTWEDGTDDAEHIVYDAGIYWVEATDGPCTARDSIVVDALSFPTISLGNDTVTCDGGGILLNPSGSDIEELLWSDGSTGLTLQVDSSASITVTGSNECGNVMDDIQITIVEPIIVDLGPDTILCGGEELVLTAEVEDWEWAWSDGSQGQTFTITTPGIYWLDAGLDECILTDTLLVDGLEPPMLDLGPDTVVCDGTGITLDPVLINVDALLWSDGSTADQLVVAESGMFSLTVTNACGSTTDSISITLMDPLAISLGPDTVLCGTDSLLLDLSGSGAALTWSDGSTANTFLVTAPGSIFVDGLQNGCTTSDTLVVGYDQLVVVDLGPDTAICNAPVITLDAGFADAHWQDNSVGATYDATRTGWYVASVMRYCGNTTDSVRISFAIPVVPIADIELCPGAKVELDPQGELIETRWTTGDTVPTITVGEGAYGYEATDIYGCEHADLVEVRILSEADGLVFIPNSFTPNGDGFNDHFLVMGPERGDFELVIHDRWGLQIHSSLDPFKGWDGTVGGQPAPPGVYVYTVHYQDQCTANGTLVSERGHVTLLR